MENEKKAGAAIVEDDDFEFGAGKKEEVDTSREEVVDEIKSEEEQQEEVEEPERKKATEKKPEAKKEEVKESKSSSKKSEEESGKEEEIDIFAPDDDTSETKDSKKLSYKELASGLGVDLDVDSEDAFKAKISEKIEKAKQEFKLDEYPEDAKLLIKHLKENDGKIEDFFNNKNIVSLQSVMNLDPEQKVLSIRVNELMKEGLSKDKAREQATEEVEALSAREIKNTADKIDDDARNLISDEIKKITGDRNKQVELQRNKALEKVSEEIKTLKTFVKSQSDFLGIPLSEKAKNAIIKDIEAGAFDDIANKSPESSKFAAYMMAKHGKQIFEILNKSKAEENRKGYNAAVDKSINALHNTKESAQQQKTGHQQSKSQNGGRFDGFSTAIDEE